MPKDLISSKTAITAKRGTAMARRKKKQGEAGKNRNLNEFLKTLKIEGDKRDKIVAFVEELTFKQLKQLSTGIKEGEEEPQKKPVRLRLNMPWDT